MTKNRLVFNPAIAIATLLAATASVLALDIPATPKQPVTNAYFATPVVDDYIWLENFDDAPVKTWNAAENKASRAYLDQLPTRPQVAARLKQLYSATSANYLDLQSRPGAIFAMKFKPPAQQPWLITLKKCPGAASRNRFS